MKTWFCNYDTPQEAAQAAERLNALALTGNPVMNCYAYRYSPGPVRAYPDMTEEERQTMAGLYRELNFAI